MIRDPALPRVFRRPDALAAGMTRAQIETRIRTGVWVVLRRGVFCLRATLDQTPPAHRHLLHAAAAQLACSTRDLVVSHISAAAHWGLPMPRRAASRCPDRWVYDAVDPTTPRRRDPGGQPLAR
jgi:hypothetical protein